MTKGHLTEYVGEAKKPKRVEASSSDDDGPPKRQNNKEITGVINVIHACTSVTAITKNSIRVQIKIAQYLEKAFAAELMSMVAYENERKSTRAYELTFTNEDMKGVDVT